MKKTILLLVAIALTSAKMMAEGLTATLQQGETMTAFYGVNAFVDAYNAAEDGAVITLSEGQFNDVTYIEKSITVIGNMAFDVEGYEKTYLFGTTIKADNVTLEGINFTGNIYLTGINNCHIKRCKVDNTLLGYDNTTHTNTVVDQCVINVECSMKYSKNYCIKNSTICCFANCNPSTNIAYISNCYICYFSQSRNSSYYQPYAIYKNCVLGMNHTGSYSTNYTTYLYSPSEFYNNYFYRTTTASGYGNYYVNHDFSNGCLHNGNTSSGNKSVYSSNFYTGNFIISSFNQTGDDGTPVGITGGSGFSPFPSVPRITSKQIDSKTDSEGKLNVKITVSTEETLIKEEKSEEDTTE